MKIDEYLDYLEFLLYNFIHIIFLSIIKVCRYII
jgi:hypothetical protein